MAKYNFKIIMRRSLSVLLMLFSLAFGATWRKYDFCLGDKVLASLGLPAWSNGTQGTHYSAIVALIVLFGAFYLFSTTTKKKDKKFRSIIMYSVALIVMINIFYFMI